MWRLLESENALHLFSHGHVLKAAQYLCSEYNGTLLSALLLAVSYSLHIVIHSYIASLYIMWDTRHDVLNTPTLPQHTAYVWHAGCMYTLATVQIPWPWYVTPAMVNTIHEPRLQGTT